MANVYELYLLWITDLKFESDDYTDETFRIQSLCVIVPNCKCVQLHCL